jgi:hypothetical protein
MANQIDNGGQGGAVSYSPGFAGFGAWLGRFFVTTASQGVKVVTGAGADALGGAVNPVTGQREGGLIASIGSNFSNALWLFGGLLVVLLIFRRR